MSKLYQKEAEAIAAKLKCELKPKGPHKSMAIIRYKGQLVGSFQIRHSKKVTHPFIAQQIGVSETEAFSIATCTMCYEEYLQRSRKVKSIREQTNPPT